MREMKDSGQPWLGMIPTDWDVIYPKMLFSQRKERAQRGERQLTASQQHGVVYQDEYMEMTGSRVVVVEKDFDILKHVEAGDFVISMRSFQGGIEYSENAGCISSAYVMLIPNQEYVHNRYFKWLLKSPTYINALQSTSNLVRDGQAMRFANFIQVWLPVIPIPEQIAIAEVLDRKCSQVDTLIANVQAQIEKLKAYKQSVITEVVTKGLDPSVPMKDSGVEWIGEIPEYWEIAKLRTRTKMLTPMRDKPEDLSGPIPWVRIEDYCGKYITASKEQLGVSAETVAAMNLKIYPVGTVLCTSSCDLGKCAIVGRELVSNQRFIGIIPQPNLSPDYLYYLMLSNAERLNTLSTGSIQANLSRVSFEQLLVQFPPMVEQEALAEYLDKKCEAADRLIAIKQKKIDKLNEYKKSLIYEYVTGKKEVS